MNIASSKPKSYGLLGKNILGSGFDFIVKVHKGAGAFVLWGINRLMTALKAGQESLDPVHRTNVVASGADQAF